MTQLSKLATLGLAKEVTPNTYLVPTIAVPFTKADFEDVIAKLDDQSWRGNDTVMQGAYPGPEHATWDIDVMAYPDLAGHLLCAVIGPDTVTAGISTTLSSTTTAGATSIQTAATIPSGSTVSIGTGATLEYFVSGSPTGTGPYTIPVATPSGGLTYAHTSSVQVSTPTTHTFKQSPGTAIPTYSLTVYDTTQYLGYSGLKFTDLQIKIDPKAALSFSVKALAFPGTVQSSVSESYTQLTPFLGWEWTSTQNAVASTRGLTLDLTVKRAGEAINSSDGTQAPREIFVGALEADGTYKAIFENQTDINLFLNYTQQAMTATITGRLLDGSPSLAVTMNKTVWSKGKRDIGSAYVQADFDISGLYNATDGGAVSAVLKNWTTASY
ncbi:phage tail tube protein [Kitasatospora sp. NBC_01302]|uniref:phage tail tube protein n=1 Tax=Kitasatospora sp. NBC_01302 TaxID=2903575 RepID=UPI002E0F46BB|nr:phage tail tube protein [Kitasatospora sp. NBC_01302]